MYRIKDWAKNFENAETRKYKHVRWVPIPNKHDGKGYRRLAKHERAVEIFCGWNLLLQVASKCPVRGVLADDDGPLSPEDLADMTGFPEAIFAIALEALSAEKIGWIEEIPEDSALLPAVPPEETPEPAGASEVLRKPPETSGAAPAELNRTELNRKEDPPLTPLAAVTPFDPIVTDIIAAYPKKREREGGGSEIVHVGRADRNLIAIFLNTWPDYPLLEAVKQYAKGTKRPMNFSRFLSNAPERDSVLKAMRGAQARDAPLSTATPSEPLGTNEDAKREAAKAFEILHGRKHGT